MVSIFILLSISTFWYTGLCFCLRFGELKFGVYGLYGFVEVVVVWDNFDSFRILNQSLDYILVMLEHEASI
jgi:hypothetical protein